MYRTASLVAVLVFASAAFADDAPLRIRNLAPASGIYGQPVAFGGEVLSTGYELTFNTQIANNFTSAANDDTLAFFDGETTYLTYGYRQSIAERFEFGVELPWVIHDGGFMDHTIQRFHSVFGMPNNGRREADLNKIDYYISDQNKVYVDFQDQKDGLGDVRLTGGYQVLRDSARLLAVRTLVKLPIGDADKLTGSGATDVAAWLDYTDRELLARFRLSMTAAAGFIVLGDGDLMPHQQNRMAGWGHFGLSYPLTDAVTLKGQLDYQSQLIDASIDQLGGAALQGTFGFSWQVTPRFWSDLAMAEDLTADSTSDVMVQLLIGTRF
jgi:hypothetical protein